MGETLLKMQEYAEAERWFRRCLIREPNFVPAHITYGELLARNVRFSSFIMTDPGLN